MRAAAVEGVTSRLSRSGIDGTTLLVLPAALFMLALFIYPFAYGVWLSLNPLKPDAAIWANYARFFSDPFLYRTIWTTLALAVPVTVINLAVAIPVAMRVRFMKRQRLLAAILILPLTLGTVLVAEGLLNYLGPQGWVNRFLLTFGIVSSPIRLVHNYWGVLFSMIIAIFPFSFLLTLSYLTGIDPAVEKAAATLGANAWERFKRILLPLILPGILVTFCLSFVQAFAVFPSAILLGAPAGPTRVISIAAATAAFEEYDYTMASAIAIVMGVVELGVVCLILGLRGLLYRGSTSGGKG